MLTKNKFHIITLGCRVNAFESNSIATTLIENGYVWTNKSSNADICIINTCSVTNKADSKSKYFINKLLKQKNKKIIVMGCFSQMNKDFFLNKNVNIVIGNKLKNNILDLIKCNENITRIEDLRKDDEFEVFQQGTFEKNTRASIKIQDGCNYMCNYCIIPFARGKQRSLDKSVVLSSIKKLIKDGYREIVLTGVNTAGYGEGQKYNFLSLLTDIDNVKGKFRVRISSLEPFQITEEIIDLLTKNKERWCQHFHICLQSGSDKVLREMNRKYSTKKFLQLCEYVRKKSALASITTDLIVGFPSETKNDFNDSVDLVKKIKFANMHIFPFSIRNYTKAQFLKNLVTENEKKKRYTIADQTNSLMTENYLKEFIGRTVNVLFENPKKTGEQVGHSQFFFTVTLQNKNNLHGKLLPVKITNFENGKLYGTLGVLK